MGMTRCFVVLLALAVSVSAQQTQSPSSQTDENFQKLIVAVSSEQWDSAVDLSSQLLKQLKPDDERLLRVRYIYLYSAAGKVSEGRMEFDDLAKSTKDFVGKQVVLPRRPITLECRGDMNFICPSGESKTKFMIAAANKTGTTILAFEYVQLKEPFDFAKHVDRPASVIGNIEAVVPNPNKSRAIVMRLFISDATIEVRTP
jgi:hypothetical protein